MSHAGAIHQFLNEIVAIPAAVPGSRPGSAIQDLILSVELGVFFLVWLRQWPRVTSSGRALFAVYALNLIGASLWCALGVYIHLFEPLPTERTTAWLAFLGLGGVTPVLFPLISVLAFKRESDSPSLRAYVLTGLAALTYALVAYTGADLSLGGRLPKDLELTPWHAADGRSYGGEAHGIPFDLMSSYPCYRGDSMFVLSTVFLIGCTTSVVLNYRESFKCKPELRGNAKRIAYALGVMLVNCLSILYLLVVFEMSIMKVFDVFHAVQGLVMAYVFFNLRVVLHSKEDVKSA